MPNYLLPFTGYGFKRIFGEPESKPLLMDFLNSLLPQDKQIADLNYRNREPLGGGIGESRSIFDVDCEGLSGEKFIVELQKSQYNWFKDRTTYYASFPIQEQMQKNEWNDDVEFVYCVGLLGFSFKDYVENDPTQNNVVHMVKCDNLHGSMCNDKLTFIYIELPKFHLQEHELNNRSDYWFYWLKHLQDFNSIPEVFKDSIFTQAFDRADVENFTRKQWQAYEYNLKAYRDLKNSIDTAYDEGFAIGLAEGRKAAAERQAKITTAKTLLSQNLTVEVIQQLTGLTEAEIQAIKY